MNNNFDLDSAIREYKRLISGRLPQPYKWDQNAYDYRHESMGRESSDNGYRSAIFYIQLSKKIDPEILYGFLRATNHYMVNNYGSNAKFNMLFLNKEDGKLLHPGKPCGGSFNALRAAKDYFAQYADTNSSYSKKLSNLFPPSDLYDRETYPSNVDLCVLVCDEDGVEFDEKIKFSAIKKPNRFIQIKVLPGSMFEVMRLREEDLNGQTDNSQQACGQA